MTKQIEFFCIGNRGRSPFAELVGRNHLRKIGALDVYDTCSSGVLVDEIKKGEAPPAKSMAPHVRTGLERNDIYSEVGVSGVEYLLRRVESGEQLSKIELDELNKVYGMAIDTFSREELEHREKALRVFGIEGRLKETQDQTVPRPDVIAAIGMDRRATDLGRGIYSGVNPQPHIDVFARMAIGNPNALTNTFGKGEKAYLEVAKFIKERTPFVIDTILRL